MRGLVCWIRHAISAVVRVGWARSFWSYWSYFSLTNSEAAFKAVLLEMGLRSHVQSLYIGATRGRRLAAPMYPLAVAALLRPAVGQSALVL